MDGEQTPGKRRNDCSTNTGHRLAPKLIGRTRSHVASEVACSSVKGGQQVVLYNMARLFNAIAKQTIWMHLTKRKHEACSMLVLAKQKVPASMVPPNPCLIFSGARGS